MRVLICELGADRKPVRSLEARVAGGIVLSASDWPQDVLDTVGRWISQGFTSGAFERPSGATTTVYSYRRLP